MEIIDSISWVAGFIPTLLLLEMLQTKNREKEIST
jgi:hypothetical protein